MHSKPVLCLAAVLALGACASTPDGREADRLALYRAHAGAAVDSFPYFRPMTEWASLGRNALAVWTSPSKAWLLDVTDCPDLEWAHAIRLSDSMSRVSARFDYVTPLGTATGAVPCRIEQIRPLDVQGIREAERARRAAR